MRESLKAQIKLKYPISCRGSDLPTLNCGDGWFELIDSLLNELEPIALVMKQQGTIELGLPKLFYIEPDRGSMKVAMDNINNAMDELIEKYQEKSESVCEACGSPGTVNGHGWVEVLCTTCAKASGR